MRKEFDQKVQAKKEILKQVISQTNTLLSYQKCCNYYLLKEMIAFFFRKCELDFGALFNQKNKELLSSMDFALTLT